MPAPLAERARCRPIRRGGEDSSAIRSNTALPNRTGQLRALTDVWWDTGSGLRESTAASAPRSSRVRIRHSAFRSAALRVEILAHDVEVGDITRQHPVERGSATKHGGFVGTSDPLVGGASVGEEKLESLVDAEDVGDSLERVAWQPHLRLLAPLEIGGPGGQPQQ